MAAVVNLSEFARSARLPPSDPCRGSGESPCRAAMDPGDLNGFSAPISAVWQGKYLPRWRNVEELMTPSARIFFGQST